ncbi:hypothetical protein [Amycolatopsis jiangsuensis]|uniref:Uncharacterized protein n=1 Tax=Amycolatopsis jiangsuensis TaxID=1181879 RepID=A0A840J435_9PSEU|nr:hypothetical protein [Amycolatopsis jiangsuensis]MBB4688623.1 hypothetical protein [Amycolatopsis jiangsuensis]
MSKAELPVLDEHRITVDAEAEVVWRAVADTADRGFAGPFATAYAWAVRCEDSSRPSASTSTATPPP